MKLSAKNVLLCATWLGFGFGLGFGFFSWPGSASPQPGQPEFPKTSGPHTTNSESQAAANDSRAGHQHPEAEPDVTPAASSEPMIEFEVLSDAWLHHSKRTIQLKIFERLGSDDLAAISEQLFRKGYERTVVSFVCNERLYALVSFEPDLHVQMFGLTPEDIVKAVNQIRQQDGNILGIWIAVFPRESVRAILSRDDEWRAIDIAKSGEIEETALSHYHGEFLFEKSVLSVKPDGTLVEVYNGKRRQQFSYTAVDVPQDES